MKLEMNEAIKLSRPCFQAEIKCEGAQISDLSEMCDLLVSGHLISTFPHSS